MSALWGTVVSTKQLTPSMVRVTLGGAGLDGFVPTEFTDQYVNALFVPDGADYTVPFDPDDARQRDPEYRPRGRRLTVRAWDATSRELTIDFVTHGDVGYAGRWANRAAVGDRLALVGPSGGYHPDRQADWYLMVGDESALPAIGASLEAIPTGAPVTVVAVVDNADYEIELSSPGALDVRWLHRATATDPSALLPATVAELDWRAGRADVFVHGEAGEVRAVRRHLLAERGVAKDQASISPYWRRGHDDERWREVKRDWIASQSHDV